MACAFRRLILSASILPTARLTQTRLELRPERRAGLLARSRPHRPPCAFNRCFGGYGRAVSRRVQSDRRHADRFRRQDGHRRQSGEGVFGAGHTLMESRAVDRTATFVFFLGDRFYGTVTAVCRRTGRRELSLHQRAGRSAAEVARARAAAALIASPVVGEAGRTSTALARQEPWRARGAGLMLVVQRSGKE